MGTGTLLLGSSIAFYLIQDQTYDDYKSTRSDFESKWDKYTDQLFLCQITISVTALFYVYNLIDAAFITRNKNISFKESPLQINLYAANGAKYDLAYVQKF